MAARRVFRFISYVLLGVIFLFLLILYSLYLSAQRLPDFYKKSLTVDRDTQEFRNELMSQKIDRLNDDLQNTGSPWQTQFTSDDLNAYFAVELSQEKDGENLLPKEIYEPRLTFSDQQTEFACRIEHGSFSGILHLTLALTLPESNRLKIRILNAKLGKLPISKEIPLRYLVEALEKKSYSVQQGTEAGDPTVTITLDVKYASGSVQLDHLIFQNGTIQLSGSTEEIKEDHEP
jgi:hypothetical protein